MESLRPGEDDQYWRDLILSGLTAFILFLQGSMVLALFLGVEGEPETEQLGKKLYTKTRQCAGFSLRRLLMGGTRTPKILFWLL